MKAAISLVLIFLMGCTATGKYNKSAELVTLSEKDAQYITDSLLVLIEAEFAQGKTTFILNPPQGSLGKALENRLRAAGYAISYDEEVSPGTPLYYIVDAIDNQVVALQLIAGAAFQVNRIYHLDAKGNIESASVFTMRLPNDAKTK